MPPRPRFSSTLETPDLRLPPGKQMGTILAVAYAPNGDLLVLHQLEGSGVAPPPEEARLPDVVRFGADGTFLEAWGGPGYIPAVDGIDQWPDGREGIECDGDGNIWIFGYKKNDDAVLKFSPRGELLLRIGQRGKAGDDEDTDLLHGPTSCYVDTKTREVFITDGYGNHRVIAFHADTGKFTRMWGSYGKNPAHQTPDEAFSNPVHKIIRAPDGRMYVCDRRGNRVQEFELIPGGAKFLREVKIAPGTMLYGAAWDIAVTPDGKYLCVSDGTSNRIWIVDRESFSVLGWSSAYPDTEGEINVPGHFQVVHRFTMEPNGDLLMACTTRGIKRLKYEGVR